MSQRKKEKTVCDMFDKEQGYIGEGDIYVSSFTEALALVETGKMSLNDAVGIIVILLHTTRRLTHSVPWNYISISLIDKIQDAAFIKSKCKVKYNLDIDQTPYLVIACPKHATNSSKCCGFTDIKVDDLIMKFNSLAEQATGYPEYIDAFQKVAKQLIAGQWNAMHILAPTRVTMCPGTCIGSVGMIVPPSCVIISKGCRCFATFCNCPLEERIEPVRVMTCPYGCSRDGKLLRWCLECGGDHDHDGRCDHKARWGRLPAETREYLDGKITAGEAQHCPKCYLVQEKLAGCDKLTCPECSEHFCLKCGDILGGDYVTDHLFPVNRGQELICRRTVIQKAFEGDARYVAEVVAAYKNRSVLVIRDVNEMLKDANPETVPDELRALVTPDRLYVQQMEEDERFAMQLMEDDFAIFEVGGIGQNHNIVDDPH